MQGNPQNIAEIETKIKYDEAIIRHLILTVEELSGEDSILLTEALENKSRRVEAVEESPRKIIKEESNEAPAEDSNKKSEES